MGLLSCFAPSQQEDTDHLSQQVQELKVALASAQKQVTQLQADRSQLLHDLASRPVTPFKQDAATEMATVSVAVQVKPPVTIESRIPRPTGEDVKEADGIKTPAKTRIPAPPLAVSSATATDAAAEPALARSPSPSRSACRSPCLSPPRSPTRSSRNLLTSEPAAAAQRAPSAAAGDAALSAAASPEAVQLAVGALRAPSFPDAGADHLSAAPAAQRVEVLQQQLKVAEAFRTSMEAELRDARFANTNLQTQMLSLQTKFEKTIEEQLREVERLITLRKEGQDAHEQAQQQVAALKHQLELQGQACASAQREAVAAAKHAAEQEQRMQQAQAEEARVREELASCVAQLEQRSKECSELAEKLQAVQQRAQAADVRVLQLQGVAQQTDEAHRAALKQVEDELRSQKAIYDSTSYHKLQSETRNHDEMVQLVQQELSELSYYAAAGRVALGVAPASSLTPPRSSEVSMGSVGGAPPPAAVAGDGAAAGEELSGELPPGVRVMHGAVLLSDGRLQLADGRVIEASYGGEVNPIVTAAVKAIRALSDGSSNGGLAAEAPEAAAQPVAAAAAEELAAAASVEAGAVAVAEGEVGEAPQAAAAGEAEVPAELQQGDGESTAAAS
uniref:Uncharacterized protein n=1 Tax=Tetradesmus obliquus TaxID=3088 RepID=A0A383W847_TETOB|eukprot:jgi/Sobl393_1/3278/SZX73798.1